MLSREESVEGKMELVESLVADEDFTSAECVVDGVVEVVGGCGTEWEGKIMARCLERKAMFALKRNEPRTAYELLEQAETIVPHSSSATINIVTALRSIPGVDNIQLLKAGQQAIAKLEIHPAANPSHLSLAYYYYSQSIEEMVREMFEKGARGGLHRKIHSVTLTYHSALEYAATHDPKGPIEKLLSKACERWSAWLTGHSTQLPFPTAAFGPSWASQVACAQSFDDSLVEEGVQVEESTVEEGTVERLREEQPVREVEEDIVKKPFCEKERERYRPLLQGRVSG